MQWAAMGRFSYILLLVIDVSLPLPPAHLHLWLWDISCPLRLFNGLQVSHGTEQSLHLVFNLHFGEWGDVGFAHLDTRGRISNLHQ